MPMHPEIKRRAAYKRGMITRKTTKRLSEAEIRKKDDRELRDLAMRWRSDLPRLSKKRMVLTICKFPIAYTHKKFDAFIKALEKARDKALQKGSTTVLVSFSAVEIVGTRPETEEEFALRHDNEQAVLDNARLARQIIKEREKEEEMESVTVSLTLSVQKLREMSAAARQRVLAKLYEEFPPESVRPEVIKKKR